jgi:hypothetical protein
MVVQSVDTENENLCLVFAFCDFPKVTVFPRNHQLVGCGKSCELELKRVAFRKELPLWVALVKCTDDFTEELCSARFDLGCLADDLGKAPEAVPFRQLHGDGRYPFDIQVRLVQSAKTADSIFLATFSSNLEPEIVRQASPRLNLTPRSVLTPRMGISPVTRHLDRLSPKCHSPGATVVPRNISFVSENQTKDVVGGKMRLRGLRIKLNCKE